MRDIHIKINPLNYKTNKCVEGKKGKEYTHFTGFEMPGFNDQDEDPRKRKIFLNDVVIYQNNNDKKDENNGLPARVVNVREPLKMEEKIEYWEKGKNQKLEDYPVKEDM